jgi:hypothetical protein
VAVAYLRVADDVKESDNIGATRQVLKNLDLALYLLLLDRLQDLDDAFLVVDNVDALKDLRVLSPAFCGVMVSKQQAAPAEGDETKAGTREKEHTNFAHHLVVFQDTPAYSS